MSGIPIHLGARQPTSNSVAPLQPQHHRQFSSSATLYSQESRQTPYSVLRIRIPYSLDDWNTLPHTMVPCSSVGMDTLKQLLVPMTSLPTEQATYLGTVRDGSALHSNAADETAMYIYCSSPIIVHGCHTPYLPTPAPCLRSTPSQQSSW